MAWTSPETKQAILVAKMAGISSHEIGRTYGVSKSTVDRVIRMVRQSDAKADITATNRLPGSDPRPSLARLKQTLLYGAHAAIDRSIQDTQEVHKAALTSLGYLKGVGEHGGERTAEVNVQVLIANVPPAFDQLMARHGLDAEVIESEDVTGVDDDGSP